MSKREDKRKLLAKAKKCANGRYSEFKCPVCKGVASVINTGFKLKAECHACGLRKDE